MTDLFDRIQGAAESIRKVWPHDAEFGVILGTGLEGLVKQMDAEAAIPYGEVEGFLETRVVGHDSRLHLGTIGGKRVIIMAGRYHLYEGHSPVEVALPVRVLQAMGAHTLLVSCACGSMNPHHASGDLGLIEDHINLMGLNPLVGVNDERLGPRFPDMCEPYDLALLARAERICLEENIRAHQVVHASVLGPNLETRAEYRALRRLGADTVGMSTIPEVLAAVHAGMKVCGVGCITDMCLPDALKPVVIEEILETAAQADEKLTVLFRRLIAEA